MDVVPTLPDIPLPAIQPNYRPLPSIDVTPLSPQRRKGWSHSFRFSIVYLIKFIKKLYERRLCLYLHIGYFLFSFLFLLVPIAYEEEDAGFTGRRFNSKMVVYSGSKTSYLPKMMTLYEQCIRVLQNNIDCE